MCCSAMKYVPAWVGMMETDMTMIAIGCDTVQTPDTQIGAGLMSRMKSYLARGRAERQLRQLDDRLLADIGLKRHDISRAIWQS
jgi:uncharacterized protein YjiS (DUF1127 family)